MSSCGDGREALGISAAGRECERHLSRASARPDAEEEKDEETQDGKTGEHPADDPARHRRVALGTETRVS